MKPGEQVSILAREIDEAGHGVGDFGELSVHVLGLLPGERAEVKIDHLSPHAPRAWGTIVRPIGPPAPERAQPWCHAFGRCGGCVWQHLAYPGQLYGKTRRVQLILPNRPVKDCWPAPQLTGYRNRGKYVVAAQEGKLFFGAYAPRGTELVDTVDCQTVEPAVREMAGRVQRALSEQTALWPHLRYVVVRANRAGQTLVALVTTSAGPAPLLVEAAQALSTAHTVLWVKNDLTSGTILTDDQEVLAGPGTLTEELCGVPVEIGASEFLQVNREQADRLYREAAGWMVERGVKQAVDLYCGAGGFALALAQRGIATLGIERDPSAIELARNAAERAGLPGLRFVTTDAESANIPDGTDGVLVDPPRKGLSDTVIAELLRAAPAHMLYVSCEPKTFARDAQRLEANGYYLTVVQPLDMMPGTGQVELLTAFERRRD